MATASYGNTDVGGPRYNQVRLGIERLLRERRLGDETPIPTEPELEDAFGVSRGTVRRAIEGLVRDGLLRVERGRGTFVNADDLARRIVHDDLVGFARPDSRSGLDISRFVPDFEGSEICEQRLVERSDWQRSRTVFIAPDNSLEGLRALALAEGKQILVPTAGLQRGFVLLDGSELAPESHLLAATLDGMERCGSRIDVRDLRSLGSAVDLMVSGAMAVTIDGVHVGSSHRYLSSEWTLLRESEAIGIDTPLVLFVHDCQILEGDIRPGPLDCIATTIVSPTRTIECGPRTGRLSARRARRTTEDDSIEIELLREVRLRGESA